MVWPTLLLPYDGTLTVWATPHPQSVIRYLNVPLLLLIHTASFEWQSRLDIYPESVKLVFWKSFWIMLCWKSSAFASLGPVHKWRQGRPHNTPSCPCGYTIIIAGVLYGQPLIIFIRNCVIKEWIRLYIYTFHVPSWPSFYLVCLF